jgi:KaiC/GvpD/RAD55 family RecA-like ATPase
MSIGIYLTYHHLHFHLFPKDLFIFRGLFSLGDSEENFGATVVALRALLKEGLPQGTSILLVGPPGSGKTSLCLQLALEVIAEGGETLYLTTESTPTNLLANAQGIGLLKDNETTGASIKFIDAYSWAIGMRQDKYAIDRINNPSDINKVSLVIMNQAQILSPSSLVIVDSVSGLTLASQKKERIRNFIHVLAHRILSQNNRVIFVLEEGAHDTTMINSLRSLVQGTIVTRIIDKDGGALRRELRILSIIGASPKTTWMEMVLGDGGLELKGG